MKKENISIVMSGDINIAHKEIDLANPKQNQKNPGFLPEERNWLTQFLNEGYLDAFRIFEKNTTAESSLNMLPLGYIFHYNFSASSIIFFYSNLKIKLKS